MSKFLVANRVMTPDGTILQSMNNHDFICHTDNNGKEYCIDGGLSYSRILGDVEDLVLLHVYNTDPFDKIREAFHWGTYGPKGDQPLKYKALKDLSIGHIKAIIDTQTHLQSWMLDIFKNELKYRGE